MSVPPALSDRQAVLHLVAPVDGPGAAAAYEKVRSAWQRCVSTLDLTEPALGLPAALPVTVGEIAAGPVAAACDAGPGLAQALAECEAGVLCLSIANVPKSPDTAWRELARVWDELTAGLDGALLGSVRIYLGYFLPGSAESSIVAAARAARLAGRHRWPGPVRAAGRLVWETGPGEDGRGERTLVVAAPAGTDPAVSAWLFSPGDGGRAPLTRYLVDAAKMHGLVRTLRDERRVIELRAGADLGVDRLAGLMSDANATEEELQAARERVAIAQAASAGVIDTIAWCRRAERSAAAAAANLAAARRACLDGAGASGPFADDLAMTESLRARIDDDLQDLSAVRERAQHLTELAGAVLASRLEARREEARRRQERFGLLQAALIGAVLMGLTAIQSLNYALPMPASAKPALVAALGAIALYLAAVALRLALPARRTLLSWLEDAALALALGSSLWLAAAWICRRAAGRVLPGWGTAAAFGAGALVAGAVATARRRRRKALGVG